MKRIINKNIDLMNKEFSEIYLKQFDTTRLIFRIVDNNQEIDLSNLKAEIVFTKPNKMIVIQNAVIDKNNKVIIADLLEDCVRNYGNSKIEVELKEETEVVSSFQINAKIEKSSKENIKSDNTPNYIEEMENTVKDLNNKGNNIIKEHEKLIEEVQNALGNINNRNEHIYILNIEEETEKGAEITLPCNYMVGQNVLDVYLNEGLLKKATSSDNEGHYYEVGENNSISNKIKLTNDWSFISGLGWYLLLKVRGYYE